MVRVRTLLTGRSWSRPHDPASISLRIRHFKRAGIGATAPGRQEGVTPLSQGIQEGQTFPREWEARPAVAQLGPTVDSVKSKSSTYDPTLEGSDRGHVPAIRLWMGRIVEM
jgi:hypothetical protein